MNLVILLLRIKEYTLFMPSIEYPAEVYLPADMTKDSLTELKEKLTAEYARLK